MLFRRLKKSVKQTGNTNAFTMGKWGLPVNVLAVCWGFFMVINVAWPRAETYGTEWYNQWAALLYSLVLLAAGGSYYWFAHIKRKSAR